MKGVTMKIVAINGSPRKGWNTHTLLEKILEGARENQAETEIIHLYDLVYQGCISCFSCKRKGILLDCCAIKDDLLPVLQKVKNCDALVLGSPIYFSAVTGELRSFIERLCFPYISYDNQPPSFGKQIKTALVYTMNCPEEVLEEIGYMQRFLADEALMKRIFGHSELLLSTETWQFDDYEKYASSMFDANQRKQRHETVFQQDCADAFALGKRLSDGMQ